MDTDKESICCCEVAQVWKLVDDFVTANREELECITNHPWFEASCLNPWTLKVASMTYRQQYTDVHNQGPNNEWVNCLHPLLGNISFCLEIKTA